ncbi:hypothetical protein [Saccharopolyspora soli]|nr:hypothetical protein [Saccharopolyspora soli]
MLPVPETGDCVMDWYADITVLHKPLIEDVAAATLTALREYVV